MSRGLRTATITAGIGILAIVLIVATLFASYYPSLRPYIQEDGLLYAIENGYCYDPKNPGLIARDWLGVRPEQSLDLLIRQFIDAYGVYHPSLSFYKGTLQGDMRRPERWEFIHVCVIGSELSTRSNITTILYFDDGPSRSVVLGMGTESGSKWNKLSVQHLYWSLPQSRAFYELNPKYGRNAFYRD